MKHESGARENGRDSMAELPQVAKSRREAFLHASVLARGGYFHLAREAIARALDEGACSVAEAYDLNARMFAQQGLLFDADACWQKAQEAESGNTAYGEARARLRRPQNTSSGFRTIALVAAFAAAFVALAAESWILERAQGRRIEALEVSLDATKHSLETTASRTSADIGALEADMNGFARADDVLAVRQAVKKAIAEAANRDDVAQFDQVVSAESKENRIALASLEDALTLRIAAVEEKQPPLVDMAAIKLDIARILSRMPRLRAHKR